MSNGTARLVDSEQRQRLFRRFGSGAESWLAELPALVEELATEWKLSIEGPAPHGRTSVVLHCQRIDGSAGILKVSPEPWLSVEEARVLRLWEGSGRVPEVWDVDPERGAVLLEAIGTGRTVALSGTVPPMEAVGTLIADLHSVAVPPEARRELHPLSSRINFLFGHFENRRSSGPAADLVPASFLHHGHAYARALAQGEEDVVLLHADLHPGNVVDGGPERGLVAVDPRACLGDAAAEAIDWALWRATSVDEVERRALTLAPIMGVPASRILAWSRACAPLFAIAQVERGKAGSEEFRLLMELSAC
ncbi:aminoglycoside phosphotransferase family protein [Allosalinactinospora lopnorensis]|uniref:aminoglycoside phosphotransferase family protein n=1 Tax=Allosalinactinospora lopnorensis TaxID=1352348 RepID=UPI000623E463|nr:aminoglycoside phosphotransferase family protein [Allosalinactinospora lopnorensis]